MFDKKILLKWSLKKIEVNVVHYSYKKKFLQENYKLYINIFSEIVFKTETNF